MTEEQLARLHQLIDEWAAGLNIGDIKFGTPIPDEEIPPARVLPKDKRVIRTKSTGDNVYEVDDVAKTKRWVRNPEVLKALGWDMSDVQEVEDSSLVGYAMAASVYKVDGEA